MDNVSLNDNKKWRTVKGSHGLGNAIRCDKSDPG
jgi:hypothetical protein